MASTTDPILQLELQATNENPNSWGTLLNNAITRIAEAVKGVETVDVTNADKTLSNTQWVVNESRNAVIRVTGTNTATRRLNVPSAQEGCWVISNTTGQELKIGVVGGADQTLVTLLAGRTAIYAVDVGGNSTFLSDNFGQTEADARYLRSTAGIDTENLADSCVTTAKIEDEAVTRGKLQEEVIDWSRLAQSSSEETPHNVLGVFAGDNDFKQVKYYAGAGGLANVNVIGKSKQDFAIPTHAWVIYVTFRILSHGSVSEANEGFLVQLNDLTNLYESAGEYAGRKRTKYNGFYICTDHGDEQHSGVMTIVRSVGDDYYASYQDIAGTNHGWGSGFRLLNTPCTKVTIRTLSGNFDSGVVGVTYA